MAADDEDEDEFESDVDVDAETKAGSMDSALKARLGLRPANEPVLCCSHFKNFLYTYRMSR